MVGYGKLRIYFIARKNIYINIKKRGMPLFLFLF